MRGPQNFVAGVVLIGLSIFVFWAVAKLKMGTLEMMGPAMFPRGIAVFLGAGGVFLLAKSFLHDGDAVGKVAFRGPVLVTISIVLFALTIRNFGIVVAGILSLIVSGYATEEAKPREVIIFALAVTAACTILFRYMLGMAVPVFVIPGTSIEF